MTDLSEVLAQIKARVDLPRLVGRDVALKKAGRAWSGLCPLHGERNPSFVVYGQPRPGWLCHGCGARGDAVSWLTTQHRMAFRDAVAQLAAEHGIAVPVPSVHCYSGAAPGGRRETSGAPPPASSVPRRDGPDTKRAAERARAIWSQARPIGADAGGASGAVVRYLAARGLALPEGDVLRAAVLPAPEGQPGMYPVMVARVQGPDGETSGIHRTYLSPIDAALAAGPVGKASGLRAAKAMLGPVGGGAVRLFPTAPVLGVAEGIETALSAAALWTMPVWAALSAVGIELLDLPFEVEKVVIFADRDEGGRGLAAARKAALRWRAEHRRVVVRMPRPPAKDYNDALMAEREKVA